MTKEEILNKLNIFKKDGFTFDEEKHIYRLNGKQLKSITRFVSSFHKPFEEDKWSKIKADERGVTQEEILLEWKKLNDDANYIGHSTHEWIENYFKRIYQELPNDERIIERINKFNIMYAKSLHRLEPVAMEVKIFSAKYELAGMFDGLFLINGQPIILDYKTNKAFHTDDDRKGTYEKLFEPFTDLYKNHLNEYSIQQSMYSLILREEAGINISNKYLLWIPPNDMKPKFFKCLDLEDRLKKYLESKTN